MSDRKAGWYWVKTDFNNEWEAAQFDGNDWHVTRADHEWSEWMLDEIGQRIPTPDEGLRTVPVEPTPSMRRAGQHAKEHDCYIDGIYADLLATAPDP